MLKTVSAAAAAALLTFTPAMAADLPQEHKATVAAPGLDEQPAKAQPQEQQASDDDIQVVIMGQGMHVQVPNPYKNPRPRMLTDAWAMRA